MNLINITPGSSASFEVDLQGARYTFSFQYNPRLGFWTVDLSLAGVDLVKGQVAAMGVMLFRGYADPRVPVNLYFAPLDDSSLDAEYSDLGARVVLVEIEAGDNLNVPV